MNISSNYTKGTNKVEDLVKIMKEFRNSQNSTERETYACMVQNLFDEWKFFPKYPKKELGMTARLFGLIIKEKIIDGVVTDIGLKCIVEGLKREGKMFDFAITALEECKDSIEHETGLESILSAEQFKENKPELYEYIQGRYNKLHGKEQKKEVVRGAGGGNRGMVGDANIGANIPGVHEQHAMRPDMATGGDMMYDAMGNPIDPRMMDPRMAQVYNKGK
jgi:hypothetical protein